MELIQFALLQVAEKFLEKDNEQEHMPIEHLNLRISDNEIDTYQKTVLAHYRLAQAIYSADLKTLTENISEVKAKITSLTRSWKAFHQDWANIRRFNQLVWTHNDKATTLAIKMLHTTQILRVLEDTDSLRIKT